MLESNHSCTLANMPVYSMNDYHTFAWIFASCTHVIQHAVHPCVFYVFSAGIPMCSKYIVSTNVAGVQWMISTYPTTVSLERPMCNVLRCIGRSRDMVDYNCVSNTIRSCIIRTWGSAIYRRPPCSMRGAFLVQVQPAANSFKYKTFGFPSRVC